MSKDTPSNPGPRSCYQRPGSCPEAPRGNRKEIHLLFPNSEARRRDEGKRQGVLSRKEEMLRKLKSAQVLFRERRRKARVDVRSKSECYDEAAMRREACGEG